MVRKERQRKVGMGSDGHFLSVPPIFKEKWNYQQVPSLCSCTDMKTCDLSVHFLLPLFLCFCSTIFSFFMSCVHSVLITFTHPGTRFAFCSRDKTQTKTSLGRKGFISAESSVSCWRSQGGTWSRRHGGMLLTGLLPCLPWFAYTTQDHLLSGGTAHESSGKCPTDTLTGHSYKGSSPVETHSSEVALVSVKFTQSSSTSVPLTFGANVWTPSSFYSE